MKPDGGADSLRRRLLARLWGPLLLLIVSGAILTFFAARYFAAQVYDQWLFDSAATLATQVKDGEAGPTVPLPPSAVEMLEWDRIDRVFYDVTSGSKHIFGNASLPQPPRRTADDVLFYDGVVNGLPVRLAAVRVGVGNGTAVVVVGETLTKRTAIVTRILTAILPIEALLLALAGLVIWLGVSSALREVDTLAGNLRRVDPESLRPLEGIERMPQEIRPLVESLNVLIMRLVAAQETVRRFVANAAHQLRTPLAAIEIQTQRALRERDPGLHQQALMAVEKAVLRLTHLTQQLLTLARAEPGAAPLARKETVDLAALARAELERWTDAAVARGVDLGYAGPAVGPFILGEPQLLGELIGNLVDNAIRYGGPDGQVTLQLSADPVAIAVQDTGPGIPPEERSRVLERFYRADAAPGTGSGLGLAIATEIAKRHGAGLRIGEGPNGRGTVVTVTFRAADIAPAAAA